MRWIRDVWVFIADSDPTIMQLIDETTVKNLELRAPCAQGDAIFIKSCMTSGRIFNFVTDTAMKEKIIQNILKIDRIIPSLYSFCEDTKYLEPCAIAIKKLLGPRSRDTIKLNLRNSFIGSQLGQELFLRQDGEHRYVHVKGNQEAEFEFNYKQLWMYAMRHFPDLVNIAPRKEPNKEKPIIKGPDQILWHYFAVLAMKLGFRSKKIEELSSAQALDWAIRNYLSRVAKYVSNEEKIEAQIIDVKQGLERKSQLHSTPHLSDISDVALLRRCGRPFENSQTEAKRHMYMNWVYTKETNATYVNSFFVQRAIFLAFFGIETERSLNGESNLKMNINESMCIDTDEQSFEDDSMHTTPDIDAHLEQHMELEQVLNDKESTPQRVSQPDVAGDTNANTGEDNENVSFYVYAGEDRTSKNTDDTFEKNGIVGVSLIDENAKISSDKQSNRVPDRTSSKRLDRVHGDGLKWRKIKKSNDETSLTILCSAEQTTENASTELNNPIINDYQKIDLMHNDEKNDKALDNQNSPSFHEQEDLTDEQTDKLVDDHGQTEKIDETVKSFDDDLSIRRDESQKKSVAFDDQEGSHKRIDRVQGHGLKWQKIKHSAHDSFVDTDGKDKNHEKSGYSDQPVSSKRRKIRNFDEKNIHTHGKWKKNIEISPLTKESPLKRCDEAYVNRAPGDGGPESIKWRRIESSASTWMPESEEEL